MAALTKQDLVDFEKRLADKYDDGHYPYLVHFSGGNEDQLIDLFREIQPGDWIFSTHRSHYHWLLSGGSPDHLEPLIARGKSMFVFDRARNFYTSSILAGTAAIAAGVAWALKRQGGPRKVWCFIGDGAADEGHFYEAARYVECQGLPCTFVIEDNNRSVSACKDERWGCYAEPCQFRCVRRYSYTPTYPHGGSGAPGWLKFKVQAVLEQMPKSRELDYGIIDVGKKYKEAVKDSMEVLAAAGAIFIGYNVRHGSAYGTLNGIPLEQRLETPVAENLMAGLAMGMSLEGFRPVLFFERQDFIYNALDALVNQADKIEIISEGQFRFPLIIRAVIGGTTPFYAGVTHTSDLTDLCRQMFTFPVLRPETSGEVLGVYRAVLDYPGPVLISEPKELHGPSVDMMPLVAPPNKSGRPRIVVPGGIGDIYWVMVKLEPFLKKEGIEEKPEIVILADEVWEPSQVRAIPFVEMVPFVTMADPPTTLMDPVKPRPKTLHDVYVRCGSRHGQTAWPGSMGYGYSMCYNGVINSGHWLEEDGLDCNWYLPLKVSDEQRQFQDECASKYGRYAVFYFSIIGDFVARNLAQFPLDKMAQGINKFIAKTELTPVFIGAWWDLHWPLPGAKPYLAQLIDMVPGAVNLVGQTTLDQAFGVMRRAELVAGYHCGLTNMAVMFKCPTVLLWAPERFPPATPLSVAPPETRNTTYVPLFTQGLTADRFTKTMEGFIDA